MSTEEFWEEQTEQSKIKAQIVSEYFFVWAKVIIGTIKRDPRSNRKIAYIDLFAGPGRYKDGSKSTPIMVLEKAIQDPDMREMLVTMFNDKDSDSHQSLHNEISQLDGIENLKYKPDIINESVGEEIVRMFEDMTLIPTLFFVDPWGYKGLSLRLVNSVLKDWGCDCIFFFNYNRINPGLSNPFVQEHMTALFGEERYKQIQPRIEGARPEDREITIVEELTNSLIDLGGKYVLPFRFRNERNTRTSHHLFFVSKAFKGYEIMKDIMAKMSSGNTDGVPSFEYHKPGPEQMTLFKMTRPLEDLEDILLEDYAGKSITVKALYEEHSVGRRYIKKNYRAVLMKMFESEKIKAHRPQKKTKCGNGWRKGSFPEDIVVTFPPQ
jgi:three-Cys-motif partner protein